MTLGRDILYAALAGLMHGGLTRNPAPLGWAEAYRAVGAVGQTCNRQSRLSACQAGLRHAAPLALWFRPKGPLSLSSRHRLGSADIHNFMRPEGPR
jgi:hypothetical protein